MLKLIKYIKSNKGKSVFDLAQNKEMRQLLKIKKQEAIEQRREMFFFGRMFNKLLRAKKPAGKVPYGFKRKKEST